MNITYSIRNLRIGSLQASTINIGVTQHSDVPNNQAASAGDPEDLEDAGVNDEEGVGINSSYPA